MRKQHAERRGRGSRLHLLIALWAHFPDASLLTPQPACSTFTEGGMCCLLPVLVASALAGIAHVLASSLQRIFFLHPLGIMKIWPQVRELDVQCVQGYLKKEIVPHVSAAIPDDTDTCRI